MYKRPSALLLICALILCLFPFIRAEASLPGAPLTVGESRNGLVRVRLASLGSFATLNLTLQGGYTVEGTGRVLSSGSSLTVQFNRASGVWSLSQDGASTAMGTSFRLNRRETGGQQGVQIAQSRVPANVYPGDIQFLARGSGGSCTPWVIVYVYMEDYLYGVLPYEIGTTAEPEAMKAQAVASRTYALRHMTGTVSEPYDVVDTTANQVYSGTPAGSMACKSAVDATRGIALRTGSVFTAAYFTGSNGGQTESIKNAWGNTGLDYLGIKDDPYDLANPDARKASFLINMEGAQSDSRVAALLNKKAAAQFGAGAAVTAVTDVYAHTPKYAAPSRLYTKLSLNVAYIRNGQTGSGTMTFDIFGELEGPLAMSINSGSNELWSVTRENGRFTVTARRYGHGVGMSQRGAITMARQGYTYDQIVAFYFEGCVRVAYTLTGGGSPAATPAPEAALQARVTTKNGSLNLRASASSSAKVLCTIPRGTVIPIYERGSVWCRTAYNGRSGYVMTAYLTFLDQASTPTPSPAPTPAPSPAPSASPGTLYAQVTTKNGSLNLRKSPSGSAKVLRTIPRGTLIPILERGASWCKTTYGGDVGYVMTQYLTFREQPASTASPTPSPAPTPSPQPGSLYARVTTVSGSLNLRKAPSSSAKVLRTIPQGAVVPVLEKGAQWCRVTYSGVTGYVMTRYLTFLNGAASPTPTPSPAAAPGLTPLDFPIRARIMCTASSLNLRAACSTDAPVLLEMPKYDMLLITALGDTWCAVDYEGHSGYCMTKYLEIVYEE